MALLQYYTTDMPASTHEDLGDVITNISPEETPALSRLPASSASQRVHSWPKDTLGARSGGVAQKEGFAYTSDTLTPRTIVSNYVEILAEQVEVSDSLEWMNTVGVSSEFAYQMGLASRQLATRIEFRLWKASLTGVSGNATLAPQMKSLNAFISTEAATFSATRALTALLVNNGLQGTWENGGYPETIYAGGARKRDLIVLNVSAYGERQLPSRGGRVEAFVDVYQGDFGTQQVVLSRDIPADTIAMIEHGRWAMAWAVRPKMVPISKIGYGTRAMIVAEYTLEAKAEEANAKIEDLG